MFATLARVARLDSPVPYVELHAHSGFSFLDGASDPEELVAEAARLGLEALALTDHNGCYGVVRFAEAAAEAGLSTIFGAELSLVPEGRQRADERAGAIEPEATHLVVLADGPEGYARLCRAISEAHLKGGEKGRPVFELEALADAHGGHWKVLTGCRKGAVRRALEAAGPSAARRALSRLVEAFGKDAVVVELSDEAGALDEARNDALACLAVEEGLPIVATTNAHYATPAGYRLATALAGIRARRSLAEVEGFLPAWAGATLRSGAEQARRFRRYPGAVEETVALGRALAFDLALVAPGLPPFPVPDGEDEHAFLRRITEEKGRERYGPREAETVPGAWAQIDRELEIIGALGFSGYFLVVWDLVEHCRRLGIFCQGRGSAANSAVCYAIGITNVDAVGLGLLFERFLSPAREGPPDIDLDIESGRRDEVIAYVYERYGRAHAAQVANVITYRPRSALREAGRVLGCSEAALRRFSKVLAALDGLPAPGEGPIPAPVLELAGNLLGRPRHLGLHSGGMVICDRPVVEVCPVEWARREGRSVLQWDKDDCAAVGLVKFDLLGLGMLEALHRMVDLVADFYGVTVDLATIPQEDEVYAMLARGDSMGVFQVESRAQMATLPRLRPRVFYDLVVEVALIRPGPIQGGSVHPYLRRRNGEEAVTYLHPLLEPALRKTLGVPLFQEQLMRMAMDAAGLSAAEADQLRQAMGAKRSRAKMERLRARLEAGMAARGIPPETAAAIFEQLAAFASFGFPESHSVSFAYLVYVSAWFKLHYPAAFLAGLLNAQPMGFWSPQSLVADARRHEVVVLRPDANASGVEASLVTDPGSVGETAVRLGLQSVRGLREATARLIAKGAPYCDLEDLARRSGARRKELEALAAAGALDSLVADPMQAPGMVRRAALWAAGALGGIGGSAPTLPGSHVGLRAPALPRMTALEEAAADLWATGITVDTHPMAHVRDALERAGIASIGVLLGAGEDRARVRVAGVVTHRQRPATARGTVFLNLEDETGVLNVICSRGLWSRVRAATAAEAALVVTGRLERQQGVVNLVAERMEGLRVPFTPSAARDFR
jgi:error-prone DNA polymerase